ncbi:MAG: hypothetical protein ACYCWW_18765 [Deltaproteobacteria bacterium]
MPAVRILSATLLLTAAPRAFAASPGAATADSGGFVRELAKVGLVREAAHEAARQTRLDGGGDLSGDVLFDVGIELARRGDEGRAIALVRLALDHTPSGTPSDLRSLALGTLELHAGDYPRAERRYSKVEAFGETPAIRGRAERMACVGHVYALDSVPSRACVEGFFQSRSVARERALELVDEIAHEERWRTYVGGTISAIVPGLGQALAGEPLDGLLALTVNGGSAVGFAALLVAGDIPDAGLLLLGFTSRYYVGNIEHAADDWQAISERRRHAAADRLLRLLAAPPAP